MNDSPCTTIFYITPVIIWNGDWKQAKLRAADSFNYILHYAFLKVFKGGIRNCNEHTQHKKTLICASSNASRQTALWNIYYINV